MAGNSASKPLNCTPNELPCITVEWWRIAWKKLCAFSRYTAFNISNRYFSIFVIARIRPLLANPVTFIDGDYECCTTRVSVTQSCDVSCTCLATLYCIEKNYNSYVTGFDKTRLTHTKTEIHFIA